MVASTVTDRELDEGLEMLATAAAGAIYVVAPCEISFWFGEKEVSPPSWIIVFTGTGSNTTPAANGKTFLVFYWNKKHTLFNLPDVTVVTVLFCIGSINAVSILPSSNPIKQISNQ